jgi:hypothetical protein
MEQKIINTGDYLIIVDDNSIIATKGQWVLETHNYTNPNTISEKSGDWNCNRNGYKDKIILAHLPLNNSPILEGVDLLPPLEKYKYTEEDIMKAYDFGSNALLGVSKNNLIQSLQQPKMPVGFKCVCSCSQCEARKQGFTLNTNCKKEYTITNSQGLTQLVGEYIY